MTLDYPWSPPHWAVGPRRVSEASKACCMTSFIPCSACNPIISLINVPKPALLGVVDGVLPWQDVYQPPMPVYYVSKPLDHHPLKYLVLLYRRCSSWNFPASVQPRPKSGCVILLHTTCLHLRSSSPFCMQLSFACA